MSIVFEFQSIDHNTLYRYIKRALPFNLTNRITSNNTKIKCIPMKVLPVILKNCAAMKHMSGMAIMQIDGCILGNAIRQVRRNVSS